MHTDSIVIRMKVFLRLRAELLKSMKNLKMRLHFEHARNKVGVPLAFSRCERARAHLCM